MKQIGWSIFFLVLFGLGLCLIAPQASVSLKRIAGKASVKRIAPNKELQGEDPEIKNSTEPKKEVYISASLEKDLLDYSESRKKTVFYEKLAEKFSDKLKSEQLIPQARDFILATSGRPEFNDREETLRMVFIDYLGDAATEKLPFQDPREATSLLKDLLSRDFSHTDMEPRQLQSVIGDKMSLMEAYTQANQDEALAYLQTQQNSRYYPYLKTGAENGLYFLGYKAEDLKELFA